MKKSSSYDLLIELCNNVICLFETLKDDEEHGLLIRDFYEETIRYIKHLAYSIMNDDQYEEFILDKQDIHDRVREDELDGGEARSVELKDAVVEYIKCLERSCPHDANYYRLKVLKSEE